MITKNFVTLYAIWEEEGSTVLTFKDSLTDDVKGIPTIVRLCPILPFINDTEQDLLTEPEIKKESGLTGETGQNMLEFR